MAILDTFYMMFKTNSAEAKAGLSDAEKAAGTFTSSVARMDEGVIAAGERIVETFAEVGGAIVAAFAFEHVKEFLAATLEVNGALQDTSERLGLAVDDLAALQSVGERFGGSAQGVIGTIDFINKGLEDIAVKGKSRLSPFFDELKVKALDAQHKVKPVVEIIKELADAFEKKTTQERAGLAERFGIDQGLLLGMAEGRRGLEDLINRQKELGVTTQADADLADKFEKKLHDLATVFHHVATELLGGIIPTMEKVVDAFMNITNFIQRHASVVEGFFIGIGGVIAAVYLPAMIRAVVATAAWLAEVLLIPALVVAAFAAFALAYDDVKNFLAGNKSVIGELTKSWPVVGEVVRTLAKDIGAAWDWIVSAVKGGANFVTGAINLAIAVFTRLETVAGNLVREIVRAWGSEFPGIAKIIGGISDAIATLIGWLGKAVEWFAKLGLSAVKALPAALAKTGDYLNSAAVSANGPQLALGGTAPNLAARTRANDDRLAALVRGQEQIQIASATPIGAIGRAGDTTTSNKTVTVNAPITVNAAPGTDAKAVAGAIGDHLTDHVRKAINAHDDGVAM